MTGDNEVIHKCCQLLKDSFCCEKNSVSIWTQIPNMIMAVVTPMVVTMMMTMMMTIMMRMRMTTTMMTAFERKRDWL